ncbi:MAG: hypothetical protein V2A58_02695 [Planctomycetota bacterium]
MSALSYPQRKGSMGRSAAAASRWAVAAMMLLASMAAAQEPVDQWSADLGGEAMMKKPGGPRGRVIYNLDCSEFFVGTFGPVAPETIDKFVDRHAVLGITDLFINVNAQRTNYRSDAWESNWDGYDPKAGDDQPFFAGIDPKRKFEAQLFKNVLALHEQGCDYAKRMIDRARQDRLRAWISLRMNDSHYPDQPNHPFHSTFWRSHPEWHLSNKGLDYEQPEVREHYMKLIREVCSRYDLDGLELDYLRFWLYFRSGREHKCAELMTEFVEEAREATRGAARRLGHPVALAVRVPSTPWIARRHGLDAVAWTKAGLVDMVIAAPWWSSVDSDVPVETWKGLLAGTDASVALSLEDGIDSGASGRRTMMHEEMRGILLSAWHRGADAVYFFNLFTGPYQRWPREDHDQLLNDAGSYAALCAGPRRHVLTIRSPWATGEPGDGRSLPYTGTGGAFRVHIGPKPLSQQNARIELVVPGHDEPLSVRLNGVLCPWSGLAEPGHIGASGWTGPQPKRHVYDVPLDALEDGYNLIEASAEREVKITWVEISVR